MKNIRKKQVLSQAIIVSIFLLGLTTTVSAVVTYHPLNLPPSPDHGTYVTTVDKEKAVMLSSVNYVADGANYIVGNNNAVGLWIIDNDAYRGSSRLSNVTIDTYGYQSYGIYKSAVGDLLVTGGNITTGNADYKNDENIGYDGFGIWLYYDEGKNRIENTTMTTYGMNASAIYTQNASLDLTAATIRTYGQMAYGVDKRNNGNLSIIGGSIITGDEQFINQFDAETYSGMGYSSSGVYIQGNGEHVIGSSNADIKTEITTYGMSANGVFVHEGALGLTNATIQTFGDYSRGVYKTGDGDLSIAGGSITTNGVSSHGVYVNGSNASLTNTAISTGANNAHAVYITGGSSAKRIQMTFDNVTFKSGSGIGIAINAAYVDVTVKGAVILNPRTKGLLRASNDRLLVASNNSNVLFTVDGILSSGIIEAQDTSVLDLKVINHGTFSGQLINGRNVTVESGSIWNVGADTAISGDLTVGGQIILSAGLTLGDGTVSFHSGSLLTFKVSRLGSGQLFGVTDLTGVDVSLDIASNLDLTSGLVLINDLSSITGLDLESINVPEGYELEEIGNQLMLKGFAPIPEPSGYAIFLGLAMFAGVMSRRYKSA